MQGCLLSLFELMHKYELGDLVLMLSGIKGAQIASRTDENQSKVPPEEYCEKLAAALDGLSIMCANFHPDPSLIHQILKLRTELMDGTADRRAPALNARLTTLLDGIDNNLKLRTFMFIPGDQAWYYENGFLFGKEFSDSFPRPALIETIEAGNCYAAGRWTACVFHCMRVVEYGLRKLAKMVGVKLTDKGRQCPIEYATWDKVITAIRNKIASTKTLPNGPRKQRRLEFYSRAADHCEYMKDIWRNEISHSRRRYNKAEALGVINRVREFVQLLVASRSSAPTLLRYNT